MTRATLIGFSAIAMWALLALLTDASGEARLGDLRELRRAIGERWWHDGVTSASLTRMDAALRATAQAWQGLAPDVSLTRSWTPLG